MKTNTSRYIAFLVVSMFLIACSTRKDTFLSRNSHALSTKYNILYNGGLAMEQGLIDLRTQYKDNFWEILPVERMQIDDKSMLPGEKKNSNFDRAETKATKAIQKHSMNIQGSEKNPQMDEAHLMLGKARYYEQRFVPALEAFNYVLYKYPSSDKIYEVKIWREKTNMRLDNDALAVNNLRKLLKEIKFKDQIFADANATLAQAFLNLEEKDSAVAKLKLARDYTKLNEEKSRYSFILGQLYDKMGYKDSAYIAYQEVIDMNRRAARQYVIHAHINQAAQFDYKNGDTIAYLKKFNDLIEDRENRPYLDALYHQMGKFYDNKKNFVQAKKNYNLSLKKKTQDTYLTASNYRNLATIYFDDAKYATAGKYYDSTLVNLKPRTREYNAIKKKRENLEDVIKYEAIVQKNDSILSLTKMNQADKTAFFQKYIDKLKETEAKLQKETEKLERIKANQQDTGDANALKNKTEQPTANTNLLGKSNSFYFYNPTTVAFGMKEFAKIWGKRELKDNWRISSLSSKDDKDDNEVTEDEKGNTKTDKPSEEQFYNPDFYISQLPSSQTTIDSLSKERNFAYYQLGVIYKEKFKEYKLAIDKFEKLLTFNPEERLILPSKYNLFKLYELTDKNKAEKIKNEIIAQYPDSRYAQILSNPSLELQNSNESPEGTYQNLYKQYESGDYKNVLVQTEAAINKFNGEEILPKLELLKANVIGKLNGLTAYRSALNFVALNYPNVEEGKTAEKMIAVNIPKLEALQLGKYQSTSWKMLYPTKDFDDKATKTLIEKITKFIKERAMDKLSISKDIYTMTDNFVVIHGLKSEEYAKGIASILKEVKEYKIQEIPIIISSENYTVVQIKKNLQDYLDGKLVENPKQPNWDGTFERPAPPKEEPKEEPRQQEVQAQKQEIKNNVKSQKNNSLNTNSSIEEEDKNFGPPPAPSGGGKTGR